MRKGSTASSTTCRSGRSELLVIAPNWLGDAVMATPFLMTLRKLYPDAIINVACSSYVYEIFSRNSSVDGLIPYKRGVWSGRAVTKRGRPRGGWDTCFVLPRSFSSALTARFSGARRRVGYGGECRSFLLTDVLPGYLYRQGHLSGVFLRLVEKVTGEAVGEVPLPVVVPPSRWREVIDRRDLGDDYLVIAPGATYGSAKVWPPERCSILASRIARETGWRVVVVGVAGERSVASSILESSDVGGVNLAGDCSLEELLSVLRGARLVIGNDSGPVHISAAMGRPTIAVFGSTSPAWTAPRGRMVDIVSCDIECSPCFERECPDGQPRCLLGIEADDVYEAALGVIEEECRA